MADPRICTNAAGRFLEISIKHFIGRCFMIKPEHSEKV